MRDRSYQVEHNNAGTLDISIQTRTAPTSESITAARLEVSMGVFTFSDGAGMNAASLISSDEPNDLKLGSDDKLVSLPPDNDFLADYILASN